MSLSALNISSQAMMSQSACLATISQNISNVSTTGYKTTDMQFATLLSSTNSVTSNYSVGGWTRTSVDSQGTPTTTSYWSDLAINGDGLFVVNTEMDGSGSTYYTRDGSFESVAIDSDGDGTEDRAYLVDSNGYYLQGWEASADGTVDSSGSALSSVWYSPNTQTAGQTTTSAAVYGTLAVSSEDQTMSLAVYGPELADDGSSTVATQSLRIDYSPTDTNTWDVSFQIEGATVTADVGSLTFDGTGVLSSTNPVTLNVTWEDGSTGSLSVDLSNVLQITENTVVDYTQQDGYTDGFFAAVNFDSSGFLNTTYSNGTVGTSFQVALADFPAINELTAVTGNLFSTSTTSGDPVLVAMDESSTSLITEALEASDVDLDDEFTRMIMTQTAYTSASKVFTVADEMFETAINLR